MNRLLHIWDWIRNHKYLVTVGVFILVMAFVDENNWIRRYQHQREIYRLSEEIARYREQYEDTKAKLNELNANPKSLEKIARENYLMKKPDEDVFIIEP